MCIQRGAFEAHIETHGAAYAALRFVFHSLRTFEPVIGVVIGIDERHIVFLGKANVFFLAQQVFFFRMDIRVVKENRVLDTARQHRFHHFTGAGRAAGMQQDLAGFAWEWNGFAFEFRRGIGHLGSRIADGAGSTLTYCGTERQGMRLLNLLRSLWYQKQMHMNSDAPILCELEFHFGNIRHLYFLSWQICNARPTKKYRFFLMRIITN
ncbi:hypothetical protein D3C81_1340810 [compost metagenome]